MTNEELTKVLREHATDWNGEQMPDVEPAKGDPTAGILRAAADLIDQQARVIEAMREALENTAEALELSLSRLNVVGPGDHQDRKADADDMGGLSALDDARAAIELAKEIGR